MKGGLWGFGHEGGQAEAIRARFADATLVVIPPSIEGDEALLRALLPVTDVMAAGHHATVAGRTSPHVCRKLVLSPGRRSVSEREVLMDGTHRGRTFADGCCNSLDRVRPDIADGEQPRIAGLKGQRSPTQCFPSPGEMCFA